MQGLSELAIFILFSYRFYTKLAIPLSELHFEKYSSF